jgi:tRNA threonylcarbamoyl adenosine modification protein YeaZ
VYALVVDSSTPAVTAAVASLQPDQVVLCAVRTTVDAKAHGELLAPQVREVLSEAGIRPRDLAAVVAGVGPGPFTGLRVGLVTAAALGQTLAIPTYGVCSLDGLGFGQHGTVLVATDARRREVYWAVYRDGVRLTGPAVGKPDAVPLDADYAVGEGADRLNLPVRDEPRYPSVLALATLAADRVLAGKPTEPLTPLYLRRPDAVAKFPPPSPPGPPPSPPGPPPSPPGPPPMPKPGKPVSR